MPRRPIDRPAEPTEAPAPIEVQASRWMLLPEAVQYSRLTDCFIRALIAKKRIPFILAGKRFVIDRFDLDDFMENEKKVSSRP